jgi:hypothetical protein
LDSNDDYGGAKFELTLELSIVNFFFFSQEPARATAPAGPNASPPLGMYVTLDIYVVYAPNILLDYATKMCIFCLTYIHI